MIINKNTKVIQSASHRGAHENWAGDDWAVVPVNLREIAITHTPFLELEFDEDENLIGITPTERISTVDERIAVLDNKIIRDLSLVVARLYDTVFALVKSVDAPTRALIAEEMLQCTPLLASDGVVEALVEIEPGGVSHWRYWVDERGKLLKSLALQ